MSNKCFNPFNKPGHGTGEGGLQIVGDWVKLLRPQFNFTADHKICTDCRKQLLKEREVGIKVEPTAGCSNVSDETMETSKNAKEVNLPTNPSADQSSPQLQPESLAEIATQDLKQKTTPCNIPNILKIQDALIHSIQCENENCLVHPCNYIKTILLSTKTCLHNHNNEYHFYCSICRQLLPFSNAHRKICKKDDCTLPFCTMLKQRRRQERAGERKENGVQRRLGDAAQRALRILFPTSPGNASATGVDENQPEPGTADGIEATEAEVNEPTAKKPRLDANAVEVNLQPTPSVATFTADATVSRIDLALAVNSPTFLRIDLTKLRQAAAVAPSTAAINKHVRLVLHVESTEKTTETAEQDLQQQSGENQPRNMGDQNRHIPPPYTVHSVHSVLPSFNTLRQHLPTQRTPAQSYPLPRATALNQMLRANNQIPTLNSAVPRFGILAFNHLGRNSLGLPVLPIFNTQRNNASRLIIPNPFFDVYK